MHFGKMAVMGGRAAVSKTEGAQAEHAENNPLMFQKKIMESLFTFLTTSF